MSDDETSIVDVGLDTRAQSFSLDMDEIDEEIGHLTLSLGENQRQVESSASAMDQLEALAESLESLYDVIAQSQEGANRLTLQVANLRINDAVTKLGLSTESFDPTLDRRSQTTLSLEKIGETLKLIGEKLVQMVKYIWEMFQKFIKWIIGFFDTTEAKAKKLKERAEELKKKGATISILATAPNTSIYDKFQVNGAYQTPSKILGTGSLSDRVMKFYKGTNPTVEAILQEVESGRIFDPQQLSRLGAAIAGSAAHYKVLGGTQTDKGAESILLINDVPGNREMEVHVPSGSARGTTVQMNQLAKLSMIVRPQKKTYPPLKKIEKLSLDEIIKTADDILEIKTEIDSQKVRVEKLGKAKDAAIRASQRASSDLKGDDQERKKHVAAASSYLKRLLLNEMVILKLQQTLVNDALKLCDIYLKQYKK